MNKKLFWGAMALVSAILLTGCGEEGRKTVSDEDICAAYKAQLDGVLKDPNMTDQDKINMIPRLSGYATCVETVGTGGLTVPAAPGSSGPPSGTNPNRADASQRAQSAAAGK